MNRAQEIASQLTEQMPKVQMRDKFKCSHNTVNQVYEIKGWKPEVINMAKVIRISKELMGAGSTNAEQVMKRFNCNKGEANRAMTKAGVRKASCFYADQMDEPMHRPMGVNWLTRRWV